MVFPAVRATTIATQRHGKHAPATIEELCFLHGPCKGVILWTTGATERVLNWTL
jgi:hypothetical protein